MTLKKFYYGWIVVAVTFAALLVSSGIRTAPSVVIKPLEAEFGWDRASISLAVAVSLFAFGFGGPIGGSLVDRFDPRRVMLGGLTLIGLGLLLLVSMSELWHLHLFWGLLAGSFFICGYTTNGLIGTHLLPHTLEHGFVEADISWALALMGVMNIIGTMASGWLSDRYDNRKLLAAYYGFRALSLAALPFILEMRGMFLFSIIYGLDWVATVPPTVNLTAQRYGRASLGTLYGWIFCSHMIGAGLASYAGGLFRDLLGDYHLIFISAAVLGLVASMLSLQISAPKKFRVAAPA